MAGFSILHSQFFGRVTGCVAVNLVVVGTRADGALAGLVPASCVSLGRVAAEMSMWRSAANARSSALPG